MESNPYESPTQSLPDARSCSFAGHVLARKWSLGSLLVAVLGLTATFVAQHNATKAMVTIARVMQDRANGEFTGIPAQVRATATTYSQRASACWTVSLCLWGIGLLLLALSVLRREPAKHVIGVTLLIAWGLVQLLLV